MNLTIISIIVLGGIGIAAAALLYVIARTFKVHEDPRIDEIESLLPGANCGACGYNGCRDFAAQCVLKGSLDGMYCPGAGNSGMQSIAQVLGVTADCVEPHVAAVRCGGTCDARPVRRMYDGPRSCAFEDRLGTGSTDCAYGCLGDGDCVNVCRWNAITIDPTTSMPVVDTGLCTGCGKCADVCPRNIIALIPATATTLVRCVNRDRGAAARKACTAACIACGKCTRTCSNAAISVTDNCASIDQTKCTGCGECIAVCPDHSITSSQK